MNRLMTHRRSRGDDYVSVIDVSEKDVLIIVLVFVVWCVMLCGVVSYVVWCGELCCVVW